MALWGLYIYAVFPVFFSSSPFYSEVWLCRYGGCFGDMTAASNSLLKCLVFWNILNCSPVEIYMRLDGWVKSVLSSGSKAGQKTVLTLLLMLAAWEESQRNLSFFLPFPLAASSLPFGPSGPDL